MSMFLNPANQYIMSAVDYLANQASMERNQQRAATRQIQMMEKRNELYENRVDKERDYQENREMEKIKAGNMAMAKQVSANPNKYSTGTRSQADSILSGQPYSENGLSMFNAVQNDIKPKEELYTLPAKYHKIFPQYANKAMPWRQVDDLMSRGNQLLKEGGSDGGAYNYGGRDYEKSSLIKRIDDRVKVLGKNFTSDKYDDGDLVRAGDKGKREDEIKVLNNAKQNIRDGKPLTERQQKIVDKMLNIKKKPEKNNPRTIESLQKEAESWMQSKIDAGMDKETVFKMFGKTKLAQQLGYQWRG